MKKLVVLSLLIIASFTIIEGKKLSWGRGSSSRRGTSGSSGSSYKPAPTSFSHAQPSYNVGQKPSSSLSGWQEKSAGSKSSKPTQTHSYPSSGTGLSGNGNHRYSQQDHQQKSHSYPQSSVGSGQYAARTPQNTNQQNHGYPTSHGLSGNGNTGTGGAAYPPSSGLSGNTGSGAGYPKQQGGLSGAPQTNYPGHSNNNGAAPPAYSASGYPGAAPHPYPGNNAGHSGSQYPANNYQGAGYHHPQGPPPAYSNNYGGGGGFGGYGGGGGGYGSHYSGGASQMPGYFGNYNNNRGVSRSGSVLKGVGIAGAGIGTVLTGLALWNLARSTGRQHHTVIYDNRGQPVAVAPDNSTNPAVADSILADLVNCTLTIDNGNSTEVLAIPCAIATSFTPDAKVDDVTVSNSTDNTKCTITVLTKAGREFMTTIPCSILLNSASQNNVTEPSVVPNDGNTENLAVSSPESQNFTGQNIANCTVGPDEKFDPSHPCYNSAAKLTVTPIYESADVAPAAAA